jgi:hypothetical protein
MGLGIYNSNPPVVVNDHILDSADLTGNVKDERMRFIPPFVPARTAAHFSVSFDPLIQDSGLADKL